MSDVTRPIYHVVPVVVSLCQAARISAGRSVIAAPAPYHVLSLAVKTEASALMAAPPPVTLATAQTLHALLE